MMKSDIEKNTFSANDLSKFLGISLVGAYNLMNTANFPSFKIGKRILVTKSAFYSWLEKQQNKCLDH